MAGTCIKICGITSAIDGRYCHQAGADFLGVIFVDSPRQVTPEIAAAIREAVPTAQLVGVFMNPTLAEVKLTTGQVALDLIQLHGDESPQLCAAVRTELGLPVINRIRPAAETDDIYPTVDGTTDRSNFFMFDLPKETDAASDLAAAQQQLWTSAATSAKNGHRVFLAGQLDRNNIEAAIAHASPYAVDLCRGVESSPGIKNYALVDEVIRRVRQ